MAQQRPPFNFPTPDRIMAMQSFFYGSEEPIGDLAPGGQKTVTVTIDIDSDFWLTAIQPSIVSLTDDPADPAKTKLAAELYSPAYAPLEFTFIDGGSNQALNKQPVPASVLMENSEDAFPSMRLLRAASLITITVRNTSATHHVVGARVTLKGMKVYYGNSAAGTTGSFI